MSIVTLSVSTTVSGGLALPFRVGGFAAAAAAVDGDWDWGRWLAGLANAPKHLLTTVADEEFGYNKKPPSPLRLDGLSGGGIWLLV